VLPKLVFQMFWISQDHRNIMTRLPSPNRHPPSNFLPWTPSIRRGLYADRPSANWSSRPAPGIVKLPNNQSHPFISRQAHPPEALEALAILGPALSLPLAWGVELASRFTGCREMAVRQVACNSSLQMTLSWTSSEVTR
jgi:hypothetical protein